MDPRIDEIVLLTHEWESMRAWWGALLGVDPRTVGQRTAVIETPGLRVVIESSDIAMNGNPEVAGVISQTVSAPPRSPPSTPTSDSSRSVPATTAPQTTPAECVFGIATPMAPTWHSACRSKPTRTSGEARRLIRIKSSPGCNRPPSPPNPNPSQRKIYTPMPNRLCMALSK